MSKLRAGVIGRTGCGDYGHGLDRVYLEMEEIEIVAVADDNPIGLNEAGNRLGTTNLYLDYREMLEKETLDIVSICPRWVKPHLDMVIAVAKAGACIFLEKPMARTLAEADAMIEACDTAGVTMGIAHQGRMHSATRYAQKLLASGAIGTILSARMRGKEDSRGGGEDMIVLGTHVFDTLRFLLDDDPTWACAHVSMADGRAITKNDAIEGPEEIGMIAGDHVHAIYGFSKGVTATFESRRNQKIDFGRFGLQILGSDGIMSVYEGSQQIRIYEAPCWRPDLTAPIRDVTKEALDSLAANKNTINKDLQMIANTAIVRDVLKARDEGRESASNGRDGRWSLEMIHGVYESHLSGTRVRLPLAKREHPLT